MKTHRMAGYALRLCLAAVIAVWAPYAAAQLSNDPTKPPSSVLSAIPENEGRQGNVLQSVLITPTDRVAIIGGERFKVGDRYGDARVVRISENEVVLRSASGSETLHLYPNIEIKPIKPPVAAAPKAAGKPKPKAKPNNVRRKPQ
jgi:MSHA biogenesis protein MshK